MRSSAKAVNFGIVYGISDFGLARDLGISVYEAKKYIASYFKQYPGIEAFINELVAKAKEKGYAETLLGRRRYLPELTSPKYMIRQFGQRVAMNMPIQGTAADIIKIAMIRTFEALEKGGYKSKLILQVHDELLIDALKTEQQAVVEILTECMQNAFELAVPLKVDVHAADSWYECK
jgi:DNA polymerase-1